MKPNILFIMCAELRAFELGCYGHPTVRTPHIDGLAEQGLRFEVAVSPAPVCQPALGTVLAVSWGQSGSVSGCSSGPRALRIDWPMASNQSQ